MVKQATSGVMPVYETLENKPDSPLKKGNLLIQRDGRKALFLIVIGLKGQTRFFLCSTAFHTTKEDLTPTLTFILRAVPHIHVRSVRRRPWLHADMIPWVKFRTNKASSKVKLESSLITDTVKNIG